MKILDQCSYCRQRIFFSLSLAGIAGKRYLTLCVSDMVADLMVDLDMQMIGGVGSLIVLRYLNFLPSPNKQILLGFTLLKFVIYQSRSTSKLETLRKREGWGKGGIECSPTSRFMFVNPLLAR